MHSKLLQIAVNSKNELVDIYQVPTGIKCDCFCPECGERLEAKNNGKIKSKLLFKNQKTAHFAHVSNKLCKNAFESSIHQLAKKTLEETKTILLPKYVEWGVKLFDSLSCSFDEIQVEKIYEKNGIRIIPDVTLIKGANILFIEFYKTHSIDRTKKEKIKSLGISTIEIDLNKIILKDNIEENQLIIKDFLETSVEHKTWIFNKKRGQIFQKLTSNSEQNISLKEKSGKRFFGQNKYNWRKH